MYYLRLTHPQQYKLHCQRNCRSKLLHLKSQYKLGPLDPPSKISQQFSHSVNAMFWFFSPIRTSYLEFSSFSSGFQTSDTIESKPVVLRRPLYFYKFFLFIASYHILIKQNPAFQRYQTLLLLIDPSIFLSWTAMFSKGWNWSQLQKFIWLSNI